MVFWSRPGVILFSSFLGAALRFLNGRLSGRENSFGATFSESRLTDRESRLTDSESSRTESESRLTDRESSRTERESEFTALLSGKG